MLRATLREWAAVVMALLLVVIGHQWLAAQTQQPTPFHAPYSATFADTATVSVAGATHGKGVYPHVAVYDNATPATAMLAQTQVDFSNGNVTVTFSSNQTGRIIIK